MAERELAGSRIRARRMALGIRQSALAQSVAVSPAYLNLIEHNRRRIGGKLLVRIAEALDIEPAQLGRGVRAELVAAVSEAAEAMPDLALDAGGAAQFASAATGWAELVAAQYRRLQEQSRAIDALTDRMTHDPQLAASMHDILSVVTAIRSTAGILAGDDTIEPEWQRRFQRNIYEDSQRLASAAQALVAYLDRAETEAAGHHFQLPQEAFEDWFSRRGYRLEEFEAEHPPEIADFVTAEARAGGVDRAMLTAFVERYRAEATALPEARLREQIGAGALDPLQIARTLGLPFGLVLRRLAWVMPELGLVQCDSSGAITLRKPVDGFAMPRFGSACPLWPLFQALGRPLMPVRRRVRQVAYVERDFTSFCIAEPREAAGYGDTVVHEATMLLVDADRAGGPSETAAPVGSSCRTCSRAQCGFRREPSVVGAPGGSAAP